MNRRLLIGSNISQPFLQYFGLSRQFEQDQSNFLCPCIVPSRRFNETAFDLTSAISQNRPTSCLACHAHGSESQKTGVATSLPKPTKPDCRIQSAQSIVYPNRHPVPRKEPRSKSGRVDRREYRKEAERSRRDLMKCNFDMLKELMNMPKRLVSRDYILDCAMGHILDLQAQEKEKEEQVLFLERELVTIKNQLGL
ncbi:hypothetical protein BDR26DRAFT_854147 [Obelidium mucronatum]|nr:hypothetical protein BDR26DRAFT_854147 [Obelidium mucronatum]